jgi:hypothetical protein
VKLLAAVATVASVIVVGASGATAQVIVSPNAEPERNDGGWIYWIAIALVVLGVVLALSIVLRYVRYAPRFQREESGPKSVKAPRIQPGREAPRRPVNITGAPVVVPAPAVAVPVPAAAAPAPVPAAAPMPAPALQAQPASAAGDGGADGAAPEGAASAASPVATNAVTPSPASGERKEVPLDQETFDRVLAELLEKGTARRVAEGQARRAAMIAARKKAGG